MAKDATITRSSTGSESVADSTASILATGDSNTYWPAIGSKDEIPGWLRDNDFIVNGHPMPNYSYRKSFRLWRCLHMETMNIWTHLLASVACVISGTVLYHHSRSSGRHSPTLGDNFAFGTSLVAAAVCFSLSTTFHTLRSHSYNIHHFWGKMDVLGICILASGGGASATYYAFYGYVVAQRVYWGLGLCSAAAAGVTLFDTGGGGSKMRTLRGGVFSLLAISAMLPIFHSIALVGWTRACRQIGAQYFLAEGLSLLLGVGCFVGRLPERLSPGMFDIWGHSHQLFHSFAVLALHFMLLLWSLDISFVIAYNEHTLCRYQVDPM